MSGAAQYYIATLVVFAGVNVMAAWGLNLQFGIAGLLNFAYIIFQAVGAYTAAVLTLGPHTQNGGYQHYIAGYNLPFPLPLIGATLVGAALAIPIGLVTLRRLRSDYQAIALLVISIIATTVVTNYQPLFNGASGISSVPPPLQSSLGLSGTAYDWLFTAFVIVLTAAVYWGLRRLTRSPLGRVMRAVRDDPDAAAGVGKNVIWLRMVAFAVGGGVAGLSGGLLVEFLGGWSPGGWLYPETFVLFAAIIVGGTGNDVGVLIGTVLVAVVFGQAVQFLPSIGPAGLIDAIQWIVIGLLLIGFLWFRPQGILPERKWPCGPDAVLARGDDLAPADVALASLREDQG